MPQWPLTWTQFGQSLTSKWQRLCRYPLIFDTLTVRLLFLLWIVLLTPMIALLLFVSQLMSRVLNTHLHQQAESSLAQLQATWQLTEVILINLTTTELSLQDRPGISLIEQRCAQQPELLCATVHVNQWRPLTRLPATTPGIAIAFDPDWLMHWRSQQAFGGRRKPFIQSLPDGLLLFWQPQPLSWVGPSDWLMVGRPFLSMLRSQIEGLTLPTGSIVSLYQKDQSERPLLQLRYDPNKPVVSLKQPLTATALSKHYVVKTLELANASTRTKMILAVGVPLSGANQTLHTFFTGGYSIFFIGLICSMGMAFLASRSVIRPLYQVLEQMDAASNSLLTLKEKPSEIVVDGVYEVTRLARGFSNLFIKLSEEYRIRDEFVATLTHDLKVPLLAERQTLDYLGQEIFGPINESQRDVVKTLSQSNYEVLRLVNSLLEVYRYDTAQVQLRQQQMPLAPVISDVLANLAPLITDKRLSLEQQLDEQSLVYVDPLEIRRVIQNLLANAIAYTPGHGTLRLRLLSGESFNQPSLSRLTDLDLSTLKQPIRLKGCSILSIQDGGIGFDRSQLDTVFQRFSSQRSHHPMSLGLGLYHSWQVVRAHGGLIWIESTEGIGSAVNLLLPASLATSQQGEPYYDRRDSHHSAG